MVKPLFTPLEQSSAACTSCKFHIKGCCFDPQKKIDGFLAAPCFGCKDVVKG
ncbi:hypothetical protein GF367_04610 [Candidatus Woesearchaeota archaeon]|nr:hypothetical protein [Candidatus Woesearchaeota archaeon]